MTLIKSISGFRGTIGGAPGDNLTPIDIVECTAAYGQMLIKKGGVRKVVVGRDGRNSGAHVKQLVIQTLLMQGFDVVDLDYSTTPTVAIAVTAEKAGGGIILTASHNPQNWNALKLLNSEGEFLSEKDANYVLSIIPERKVEFAESQYFGRYIRAENYFNKHVDLICRLPYINERLIRNTGFKVVVDCINSTGAMAIPVLLECLVVDYILINKDVTGEFAHNPEPLPENMNQLVKEVVRYKADLGICVDPDVDRLALVCEDGSVFGEEYTLVAAADFILSKKKGNTVSNLSSSRALSDITARHGGQHYPSAVGEAHVVEKMKEVNAVIGGEGNGGVILPDLHYGRDALAGIALILNHLAEKSISLRELKGTYPTYYMSKSKIELSSGTDLDAMIKKVDQSYPDAKKNREDGLKVDFENGWIHLRKSNTEPIIRIYAESTRPGEADRLCQEVLLKFIKLK